MKYELLTTTDEGVKIYARIDEDGKCRVTCTEDNPEYQAWVKLEAEQSTPMISADEQFSTRHIASIDSGCFGRGRHS